MPWSPRVRRLAVHWVVVAVGTGLYLLAHLTIGAELLAQRNLHPHRGDQAHNMVMAARAAERAEADPAKGFSGNIRGWLPHYTDGVVEPLWPRLAAVFHTEDDEQFFLAGKRWNLAFSAVFLGLVAVLVAAGWSAPAVLLFLLAAGLGSVLPRATWFQPEPVYYALFFLSWVTCLAILKRNRVWLYAFLGLVAGLAYLAKASVIPLLACFFVVSGLRFLAAVAPRWGRRREEEPRSDWHPSNHFIGMALMASVFLVVISPRLSHSQEAFGDPLHSYPSYWMWMDDFEQGYAWMGAHNTRAKLEATPKEQRPSARRWLDEHGPAEGWRRLADGAWWQVRRLMASDPVPRTKQGEPKKPWRDLLEHRGWTLAGLGGLAALAVALGWGARRREKLPAHCQQPEGGMLVFFVVSAVAGYAMLHGWYTPVGDGDRFMLALWAPLVFSLIDGGEGVVRRLRARGELPRHIRAYRALQWTLAALLAWRLLELLSHPRFA